MPLRDLDATAILRLTDRPSGQQGLIWVLRCSRNVRVSSIEALFNPDSHKARRTLRSVILDTDDVPFKALMLRAERWRYTGTLGSLKMPKQP